MKDMIQKGSIPIIARKKCERLSDLKTKCSAKDTMSEIILTKSIIFLN